MTPDGQAVAPARGSKTKSKPSSSSSAGSQYDPSAVPTAQEAVATAVAEAETASPWSSSLQAQLFPQQEASIEAKILEDVNADPEVIDAREDLNQALRDQRDAALGVDPNRTYKPAKIKKQVDVLSWKEYRNLSPLQKDAVDFNTDLVAAVRKDKKLQDTYNPDKDDKAVYAEAIDKVFPGATTDSDTYAPETLALLQQIGYSDDLTDIDDFLYLDAAIKDKDLKNLLPQGDGPNQASSDRLGRPSGGGNTYENPLEGDRVGHAERLAIGYQNVQSTLEKGNALLRSLDVDFMAEAREDKVMLLGGAPTTEATLPGYGGAKLDQYFQDAFSMLTGKQYDPQITFGHLQMDLSEDQRMAFMDYAKSRLAGAIEESGGAKEHSADYRSPKAIAKLLGLIQAEQAKIAESQKGGTDAGQRVDSTRQEQEQGQGYS
jgi:hypothetical protein